jgi:hypothetical protein
MKEIKLTQGKVALVDDEDFEYLNQWKWTAKQCGIFYYAVRRKKTDGKSIQYYMHRVILNTPTCLQVDHIDHDGLNNQKHNLRNCTCSQNRMNRIPRSKSGYLGVYYVKHYIVAQFPINGKMTHLGMFDTEELAAKKYDEYALKYYGEFANLNFK